MRIFNLYFRKTANGFSIHVPSRSPRTAEEGGSDPFEIRKDDPIKLNVGGAKGHPRFPGWKVVDVRSQADVVLDISRQPLPFVDGSVNVIFCSHTLEHIVPQHLDFVLGEFKRVMEPGNSLLRIAVPDIEKAIRAYMEKDHAFFETSEISTTDPGAPLGGKLASWFYSTRLDARTGNESEMKGHVHCFDEEYLLHRLRRAGFPKVWRSEFRNSALPELREKGFDRYPSESLFVEALS